MQYWHGVSPYVFRYRRGLVSMSTNMVSCYYQIRSGLELGEIAVLVVDLPHTWYPPIRVGPTPFLCTVWY